MANKITGLKLGTTVNPTNGEEVVRVYAVVEGIAQPIKVLGTQDDLKKFGKPAAVMAALLIKEGEFGMYAHLPQVAFVPLTW